jgi:hypothetical protein
VPSRQGNRFIAEEQFRVFPWCHDPSTAIFEGGIEARLLRKRWTKPIASSASSARLPRF